MSLPIVALVGRPNVGKSTLFNRLAGRRIAITHDKPGVTRDSLYAQVEWEERSLSLVDTGGIVFDTENKIEEEILLQAQDAVENADYILFITDGREGLIPLDKEIGQYLRQGGQRVIVVVNKVDGLELEDRLIADFHSLGMPLHAVSAEHGIGLNDLRDIILKNIPLAEKEPDTKDFKVAVIGRPNAGKSSLINALAKQHRLIVDDVAGTTRDSVEVAINWKGDNFIFVDTAGMRRRSKTTETLEKFSAIRAINAAKNSDMVIILVDATSGFVVQDKKLLSFLEREKIPFLVAINKADLIPQRSLKEYEEKLKREMSFCSYAPSFFISAQEKTGLNKIFSAIYSMRKQCTLKATTGELNRLVQFVMTKHQPPLVKGRRLKIYYITQGASNPPSFILFVNDQSLVKPAYMKYLENQIRYVFKIDSAPMRLMLRSSHERKK